MKLLNGLRPYLLLLILLVGSIEASRLLAVLVPYDVSSRSSSSNSILSQAPQQRSRQQQQRSRNSMNRSTRSLVDHFYLNRRSIQNCAIEAEDENTFLAMDRLCEACHEMYRHTDPNLRANCRSNCFDNDDFVFCFNHFAGVEVTRGKRK